VKKNENGRKEEEGVTIAGRAERRGKKKGRAYP